MLKTEDLPLIGLKLIRPQIFFDDRGYFLENFNAKEMIAAGITENFVQDNESLSNKGVLRGLHFQNPPFAQGKLVRVISGAVIDLVVDIRTNSPTYKQHFSIDISAENKLILYIPPGFAHGFVTLEDKTIFQYKCTNFWNKEAESGILWNDDSLNIDWKISNPILSEKDLALPLLKNTVNLFVE